MRIRISHTTTYRYETPPKGVTQLLRLTPRNHDSQYIVDWRIELSEDCELHQHEDAFGNITHAFTLDGPCNEWSVAVHGIVETQDTHGLVEGTIERFPPGLFLRETDLTQPDSAITNFAAALRAENKAEDTLALLHRLMREVNATMTFDTDPTHTATTAAEAFRMQRGVCQDLTHVFITAARELRVPARYIGGHFRRNDGVISQEGGHAWAEAYVENLGWVGFDAANGISTTDAHVRIAAGLDYLGAAPVRGTRYGGTGETMTVSVLVDQALQQSQN